MKIFTARYMGRCKGNIKEVKRQVKPLTLKHQIIEIKLVVLRFGREI